MVSERDVWASDSYRGARAQSDKVSWKQDKGGVARKGGAAFCVLQIIKEINFSLMKTNEQRIRRLEIWNRALLFLLVLVALIGAGFMLDSKIRSGLRSLTVHWKPSGEIKFSSPSDGPLIVTHLIRFGSSEAEKIVAQLPRSLAIVDSSGAEISGDEAKLLKWLNIYGEPATAPKAGAKIGALYLSPQVASSPKSFHATTRPSR